MKKFFHPGSLLSFVPFVPPQPPSPEKSPLPRNIFLPLISPSRGYVPTSLFFRGPSLVGVFCGHFLFPLQPSLSFNYPLPLRLPRKLRLILRSHLPGVDLPLVSLRRGSWTRSVRSCPISPLRPTKLLSSLSLSRPSRNFLCRPVSSES